MTDGEIRSDDVRRAGPPPVPPPSEPPSGLPAGRTSGAHSSSWTAWLTPRLVIGLFVLGVGLVLFLEKFGIFLDPVLRWWPALLIVLGAIKLTSPHGRVFGVILTGVGTVLLLDNLGWIEFDDWDKLWPLAVIAVGALLIWGGWRRPRRSAELRAPGVASTDDATFSATAVMGGVRRQITSKAFVGGEATAIMGGVEIDLGRAEMAGEEAEIEVFAMWGGVEIAVPDHWLVELRGMPLLGAFEDSTRPRTADSGRRLVIRGMALMGGVEIKSGELSKSF
jgi:predicted membrane protein